MLRLIPLIGLAALLAGCQQSEPPDQPEPEAPPTETTEQADSSMDQSVPGDEATAEACALSVGWDPWEPYHYSGAGGQVLGLDIDLVERVAERADCELDFLQGNWAGLLRLVQAGELDMLLGATHTPEREAFARFSEPYREERFALFVRAMEYDDFAEKSLEALLDDGFRLGVTQGYIYSDPILDAQDDERFSDQLIESAVGELNFTQLMDHRIDGFVEDPYVAAAIERRRDWGAQFRALPLDFGAGQVRFLFSRESVSADTVERFDAALAELRSEGEMENIKSDYLD